MNMLLAQKDRILAALPGPLSGVMNMGTDVPHVGRVTTGPAQSSRRWLWTALTLLAALFAIWLFSRRPEVAQTTQRTADAIQEGVGTAVSGLGAFVSRALPDGVRLNVPESGMESRLLAFLGNPALPVDDTTWFDFDRINFATGSATLTPDSREQLSNLAAILNAYPSVRFKVGGYTDNTGDPAANMKLSTDRANSVRNDLMALGVSADRMTAEGYGDQHPIADNSTEEGRARNRRISIRLLER
jgi:outer membrane protein OmpA-like peptidoglycan-associated protein